MKMVCLERTKDSTRWREGWQSLLGGGGCPSEEGWEDGAGGGGGGGGGAGGGGGGGGVGGGGGISFFVSMVYFSSVHAAVRERHLLAEPGSGPDG